MPAGGLVERLGEMVESNSWPRVVAQVEAGGKARVNIGGTITDCTAGSVEGARARVIDQVGQTAAQLGRSLHAWMIDPGGQWPVIVRPDGTVEARVSDCLCKGVDPSE